MHGGYNILLRKTRLNPRHKEAIIIMKWRVAIALTALFPMTPLPAQTTEDAVTAAVHRLFDGMRAGDTAMMQSVMHPEARLMRAGSDSVDVLPFSDLITSVGNRTGDPLDEQIWDVKVNIDDPLATLWTKYVFYVGDTFSHCGVDAFQLANILGEWKIIHVTDTQQTENCHVPPALTKH